MTDLNKARLGVGKSKLDLIRQVQLTPASPLAPSPSPEVERADGGTANGTPGEKTGLREVSPQPTKRPGKPRSEPDRNLVNNKVRTAQHLFTFAFSISHFEQAQTLAAIIGCKMDDIIALIARQFRSDLVDGRVEIVQPRVGPGKRIVLRINQNMIDEVRAMRDPLNVRSDGFLLRPAVLATLDEIADRVLRELKNKYEKQI